MRKKFLLMILILSLFSSMGGGYLYGQTDVTTVTSETELRAALAKSGNVKLVGDIEVEETIGVPYVTVNLDLNGYSIKAKTNDIYPINNDGILTIEDTKGGGVIEGLGLSSGFDNNAKGTRSAGAELYIEGGTFKNLNPETGAAVYVHQGEATINGGIFYGRNIAVMSANGTVEINGGFIDGYEAAIVSSASVKIKNATVISGQCRTENGGNIFTAPGVTNTYYEARIVEGNDHTSYPTLDDAIAAAKDKSGDVTVEILKKATMKSSLSGDYSSIKFVGKYTDSEIYLDVQGYITATGKNVAFENLTLSKSQGGFITNAGFMNVAFGVYDVPRVTYNNCVFANGAYASSGEVIYTGCTFKKSWDKYGLWAYGDVDVTVDGGKFADYRGIKMYAEGAAKTVDLTVKNVDFSAVTDKPAIVLTYGESVTLEDNTYSDTGVFELDKDGAPNGTVVTADITDISCMNDNHTDCGVLVDGKIYTTIDDAKDVAKEGSTVTLFYEPETQVELSYGVTLNDNGYNADGDVVVRDYYTYAEFNEYVRSGNCTNLQGRKVVLKDSERSYYNNKTAQFFVGATDVNITDPVETVSVSNVTFEFLDDDNTNTYTSGELQVFAKNISFNECTFIGTAVSPWGVSNNENAETATFTKCNWKNLSGRYGVHQNRASNLTVTGCTFTNCERGIHTNSSTPISINITKNTFTGIGAGYGVLCLAENGNVGNATLKITGNNATGQTFLRQLNENATYEQISAILNTANNTYGTAYVEGSKVPTAKIGDKTYYSLQKAIDAVGAGDVVIELLDDATLDYNAREAYGKAETTSLTINGNGKTLTLNQKNSDWCSFGLANANAKVVFNNMTIEKTGYGDTSGAWNTHAIIFSCPLEMTGVTVNNAIAVQNGATLNNVTINEAGEYYGLWINGNGQTVTMNGGAINAENGRGIKIADQYIDSPASVTLNVTGTKFTTDKKAAVLVTSTAGAKITANNVDITNVAADDVNFVWVDEDRAANYGEVEVTGATVAQEAVESFPIIVKNGDKVVSYFKNLDDLFDNVSAYAKVSNVTVELTDDVVATKLVKTNSLKTYNFVTNVAEGVTMDLQYASDWNYFRKVNIGENVTVKCKYLVFSTETTIAGTVDAYYPYISGGKVTVAETGTLKYEGGDGLQVKGNGAVLTVNGTVIAPTINVWVGNAQLVVSGANAKVQSNWIDIWDGTPSVAINNGATIETNKIKVSRGGEITVTDAKLIAAESIEVGHNGNSAGKLTESGNSTITGEIKMTAIESIVKSDGGLTVTTNISGYMVVFENNEYVVVPIVAKIGETNYASLQDAINEGGNITIYCDIALAEGLTVAANKTVALDLNGKIVSMVYAEDATANHAMIKNYGNLTINSSEEGGKLSYKYTGSDLGTNYSANTVNSEPGSVLTVKGGTIENLTYGSGIIAYAIDGLTNGNMGDVTVNIEGGTVTSLRQAVRIFANSTTNTGILNISGGEFTGRVIVQNANAYANKAVLNISGGTFNINEYKTDVLYVGGSNSETIDIEASVTAGTFNGDITYTNVKKFISGGTFSSDVTEYCADGYICTQNADGTYGIVDDPVNEYIDNIAELIAFRDAVNNGNSYANMTVYLAADIELPEVQTRGAEESNWTPIGNSTYKFQGTFDGQDHTISNLVIEGGTNSNQGFFGFTTNGEIKNLTIENAKVSGRLNVGVVAGTPYTSKYTNIKVTGHVEVNGMAYVGGVGGKNAYANWTNITVDVDNTSYVKATSTENGTAYRTYVGGVIGFIGEGGHTFKNITSNIKVIGDVMDIGGISGIAHYGNKFENVTFNGAVEAPEGATQVGGIAGVWHNQAGQTVTFTSCDVTDNATIMVGTNDVTEECAVVGGAYNAENVTAAVSGSLIIDGEEAWLSVAKIGDVTYRTLADAVEAAKNNDIITLLWNRVEEEGNVTAEDAPIAMNASLYGDKTITITGTATVDWTKGNLFIGRGGEGNGKVIFDGADITSYAKPTVASTGFHVSGSKATDNNTNDGVLVIKNSKIEVDYLINRNEVIVEGNSTLTVYGGIYTHGRNATESSYGTAKTATLTIESGSTVVVVNENGMGVGGESNGVMTVKGTYKANNLTVSSIGLVNVNGGNVKVAGTLANNGTVYVTGESNLDATVTGDGWFYMNGVTLNADTKLLGAKVGFINGTNNIVGSTIKDGWFSVGIGQNAAATAAAVFAEANDITLDDVTVNVSGNATIYTSTDAAYTGWVGSAYSADKDDNKYILNITNSLARFGYMHVSKDGELNVTGRSDNQYEYAGNSVDFYAGTFINNGNVTLNGVDAWAQYTKISVDHADAVLNITNGTKYEANCTTGNVSANTFLYYNAGTVNVDATSSVNIEKATELVAGAELNIAGNVTAKGAVTNNGTINLTDIAAKFTAQSGLTVVDKGNNEDYKVVYKEGAYQFVLKDYVAQVKNAEVVRAKFESFAEAATAAQNDETIELLWTEGHDPIAMNASFYGKKVTITGTATVDWSKGWFFVGCGGEGNATVTFEGANLTSASANANNGLGIHVSGREKDTNNKYDGTVVIRNSNIDLDYLINKGTMTLDNSTLTVKNGFAVGGRPASETESGEDATATMTLNNGSKVVVNNHNGMGLGYEAIGVMNIDATSTFETTQDFLVTANGTMNNNGGNITINGTLTVNGNLNSSGNITGTITKDDNATIILTGGTYTQDVNEWCHADYDAIYNGNNTWTVIQVAGSQTRELATPGWYWFSTYIDLEGSAGLEKLQNAFNVEDQNGNIVCVGNSIKSRTQFSQYYDGYGWDGNLQAITTAQMYMINTDPVTLELTGDFVEAGRQIPLVYGWNSIGYPVRNTMSINYAFENIFVPTEGDVFKSKNKTSFYEDGEWFPEITLEPGHGYMYQSKSSESKTLVYKSNNNRNTENKTNIDEVDYHWLVDATQYPGNMTIVAMLSIDNEIVKYNYEIAAFANGECRGSARPMYNDRLGAYILILTIHGEEVEELTFKYYDVNYGTEYELSNRINYSDNAIIGSLEEPYMFNLGILNIDESSVENISIYPNPTTTGKEINLQAVCDKVEVFNALGVKVAEYTNVDSIDAIETAGIYVIRVTIDGNARNCRLVVK